MCGISGFYSKIFFNSNNNVINRMSSALYHRGPDSSKFWNDKNSGIVFGHQRLSILDLTAAGEQPMLSNSKRFIITFNGEIYNHLKIRKDLEEISPNLKWKSRTDTETLLESIELLGIEKTLKKIVGMFAFAIWDRKKRILTLARDRMGEKPLYYGWQGKGIKKVFLFASELKALKQHPEFNSEINRNAIALQLRHNYIPDPHCIYKDIFKLMPGHYLHLKENDLKKGSTPKAIKYWCLLQTAINGHKNQLSINALEIQNNLEEHLKNSVKSQMLSDVPIGAFLSGGIDSSLIVSLMQRQSSKQIKTFTIGYDQSRSNETNHAKKIANYLGTDHTELHFSSKSLMDIIPKLHTIYDEPFSDNSQIPTFLISQLAKKKIKVVLTGDGSDELFGGYNRYTTTNSWSKKFNFVPNLIRKFLANNIETLSDKDFRLIFSLFSNVDKKNIISGHKTKTINALKTNNLLDLYYVLSSHFQNPANVILKSKETSILNPRLKSKVGMLNNYEMMMVLDQITYLPYDILVKVDRACMASSIEARTPFLDHRLIEYSWKIPHSLKIRNGKSKWILRKILKNYVPENLTDRPKMGFSVPLDNWLKGPLREWAENLLDKKKLVESGYFNAELVRKRWQEHMSSKNMPCYDLWNILMFQAWKEGNK